MRAAVWLVAGVLSVASLAVGEFSLFALLDHPAIQYTWGRVSDPVAELNQKLRTHQVELAFDGPRGFLASVLNVLRIPVESQVLVFSKTSLQAKIIGPQRPRSIFFNDSVYVGWVPGEPFVEAAAQDPRQGIIFYTLDQRPSEKPQFIRRNDCLSCHDVGVPGLVVRSVFPAVDGKPFPRLESHTPDHRTPLEQRWGGWYVTGEQGVAHHMGNSVFTESGDAESLVSGHALDIKSLKGEIDQPGAYLSGYSDIVALMILDHQAHMVNLLTAVGWQSRIALHEKRVHEQSIGYDRPSNLSDPHELGPPITEAVKAVVDYMLFVDEQPLPNRIRGSSGFTETFEGQGLRDRKGRSLRDLDLRTRLMRFPCSYMIYTNVFDGLPQESKEAIYRRLWNILSGAVDDKTYSRLTQRPQSHRPNFTRNQVWVTELLSCGQALKPSYTVIDLVLAQSLRHFMAIRTQRAAAPQGSTGLNTGRPPRIALDGQQSDDRI